MLTHISITSARPATKTYLLRDTQGLYLAIQPTGLKLWRLNYRYLDKHEDSLPRPLRALDGMRPDSRLRKASIRRLKRSDIARVTFVVEQRP
ncbi:Arm DNA-binding domain-containing protein [Sphingobium lignivorans]|uniref:Integrase DNA-binding domain-containing protein n=1 Tax=Sphingobium lignivorans TaxID=2735886 RepID=A0ABR6NHD1_9SPHN|nr:Arm DNA-binding domain-containing protein [Sphingobium lignivorans]MBB5986687.1 hypothetical protein [Sphingobium lignivorans]